MESIVTQTIAEPESPSRIPLPIPRQDNNALSEVTQPAQEVLLAGKPTVTLIEAATQDVITLMSAENSGLDASDSFTAMVESPEPKGKVTKKKSEERQIESESQIKGSSQASLAEPKDSVSSLAPSNAKPKNPLMNLPHKLGSLPRYMKHGPKKQDSAAEPNDQLSSSSTLSRLSTAPATSMKPPSGAVTKKPAEKKPKSVIEANILSASSTQSRLSTAPSTKGAPTLMSAAQKTETLEKSNNLFAQKNLTLKKQVEVLTQELKESTKKLKEAETVLVNKETMLKDKTNRIHNLELQRSKLQRDTNKNSGDSEKVASLETQLATLQKDKESLQKKNLQQESLLNKQRHENLRLEKELKKTLDLNDQILAASQNKDNGDGGAREKIDLVIKDLRKQLKQRDAEISSLKRDSSALNEENVSCNRINRISD